MPNTAVTEALQRGMTIIGQPYQFTDQVDPRFDDMSSKIGRKYIENILLHAPILTMIPGEPNYLPSVDGEEAKDSTSMELMQKASDRFEALRGTTSLTDLQSDGSEIRYYDFRPSYTKYISYVNIMARAMATYLELDEVDPVTGVSYSQYDWSNWAGTGAWNGATSNILESVKDSIYTYVDKTVTKVEQILGKDTYVLKEGEAVDKEGYIIDAKTKKRKTVKKPTYVQKEVSIGEKDFLYQTTNPVTQKINKDGSATITENEDIFETLDSIFTQHNYVQFYVDSETTSYDEDFGNETSSSQLKQAMDGGSAIFKELAFVMGSGGATALAGQMTEFTDEAMDSLNKNLAKGGTIISSMGRLLGLGGNVIKGENVIMPDVYQSSSRHANYNIVLKLKNIYGTKYGFYRNIAVPMAFSLGFVLPRQTTANTYASPFLVKAYMDGVFTCNLGMITQMGIDKSVNPTSWTNDGLPNEVNITFGIVDLYSDLSMSPQENPLLFLNNSSMIDFLSTTCGLDMVTPRLKIKADLTWNTVTNAVDDFPKTITSYFMESIDNLLYQIIGF